MYSPKTKFVMAFINNVLTLIIVEVAQDGPGKGAALVSMQKGDGGEFQHYLKKPGAEWAQLSKYEDRIVQATLAPSGEVVMISRKDAPSLPWAVSRSRTAPILSIRAASSSLLQDQTRFSSW